MSGNEKYLHGYTTTEQDRLLHQSEFLENDIYKNIFFESGSHILEVGSGVGAQTKILRRRFADCKITCVDMSAEQIERAASHLGADISAGMVELKQSNAEKMPFADGEFSAAFLCWFLEHVPYPEKVLGETYRCLKPGAKIVCTEVMNSTLFIEPKQPAIELIWNQFNVHQQELGGDPFIGAKLPLLMNRVGFKDIKLDTINYSFDASDPVKLGNFLNYWEGIILSATDSLIAAQKITKQDVVEMQKAFKDVQKSPNGVFWYSAFQVSAVV